MFAASTSKGICLLCFYDRTYIDAHIKTLQERFNAQILASSSKYLVQLQLELDEYFQGKRTHFTIPIELSGTTFETKCYKALLSIAYGKTISYKEEAQIIDNPKAYRAVANANSQNLIEIIVPCHRVIQADGKLGGYSSGIDKKIFLLNLERETLNKSKVDLNL